MLKKIPVTPDPQAMLTDILPCRRVVCGLEFHITTLTLCVWCLSFRVLLPSFCAFAYATDSFCLVLSGIPLH